MWLRMRTGVVLCIVSIIAALLGSGCNASTSPAPSSSTPHSSTGSVNASVIITRHQDLFAPFLLPIQPYTTVTWRNMDAVAHAVVTTPGRSPYLNPVSFSFELPAGASVRYTLTHPGIYHYYDTTVTTWNASLSRVVAKRNTRNFPLAMEGIIWVQGAIRGLPSVAINQIPQGHDDFAAEFIAISSPGTVSWHNYDEDPHFVGAVPGWPAPLNPADIGLHRLAGTDDVPSGETTTVLFKKPGLYYYYCRNHDTLDPATHRARTRIEASDYPIPMEGFILVVAG